MPTFEKEKVTVVFVLGGPGAGKGTQSERLVKEFGFCHLSAGDLLRAEQIREGSAYGDLIRTYIREGTIVPMEVTIKLLENAMLAEIATRDSLSTTAAGAGEGWGNGKGRFLIDGFPRKMDQAMKFDETVCESSVVVYFATTEEVLLARLMERGKTSGREDDNAESIKKRFRTYKIDTMPVIEHYASQGKVAEVDSSGSIEEVYELARGVIKDVFAGKYA